MWCIREAITPVAEDAALSRPENGLLCQMVIERHVCTLQLATVG
jgi:hypothetical protein